MTILPPGGNAVLPSRQFSLLISSDSISSRQIRFYSVLISKSQSAETHGDTVGTFKPTSRCQAVRFTSSGLAGFGSFNIDLDQLPTDIERIILISFVDEDTSGFVDFGCLNIEAGLISGKIDCSRLEEKALLVAEVYQRNGEWKLRINGQGYVQGLRALSDNLGIPLMYLKDISAPAAPPQLDAKGNSRVSLTKSNKSISLTKTGSSYGKILVNLNWNKRTERAGLFGRKSSGIDLDLGAFVETIDDQCFVVQALGNMFGSYEHAPFTRLLEDDRTGAAETGEWININGDKWSKIRRVLVYAFIYEGVPNWQETDGIIRVIVPGQPEIEVKMNEFGDTRGTCAVATLENVGGDVKVTREVTFHKSQKEMDREYKWGFNWTVGRK